MKYVPKEVDDTINTPQKRPFLEFTQLVLGCTLFTYLTYLALGFCAEHIINNYSDKVEVTMAKAFSKQFQHDENYNLQREKIQVLVDRLAKNSVRPNTKYNIVIVESKQANAFALPGNTIVILTKLYELAESENEFAMILAHEISHFIHKDHLKGLGRGLTLAFISAVITGGASEISSLIVSLFDLTLKKFSREQESAADEMALDIMNKAYGHVGGTTDFFKRMAEGEPAFMSLITFSATHPLSSNRVKRLEELAKKKGYQFRKVTENKLHISQYLNKQEAY